jgi:hypothetical protein
MATVKRTTTTVKTPQREQPPEEIEQSGLGDRWPEAPVGDNTESPWPDEESARPEEAVLVKTVGQEQLERSREMQAMGIDNWVAAHDERDPEDQPRAIEGVTPLER